MDLLGRNRIVAAETAGADAKRTIAQATDSAFAKITPNNFIYKSLSHWAYNISIGCQHACRFCYVSTTQRSRPGEATENAGPVAKILQQFGVTDAEAQWGEYVLVWPWDEAKFLASLKRAEETPRDALKTDSNRAILLCSTRDPYQTVVIPGNPAKTKLINGQVRFLVRRALELIERDSTLNVRILTRSPLAKQDFDLYRKFGNRLRFGMSLPTLNDRRAKIYEPKAPAPSQRLATLQAAKDAGLHLYVAMAPTYPECNETDLRKTLAAIKELNPFTIFHEPINMRGDNVGRIERHARKLDEKVDPAVFDGSGPKWRNYAVNQLRSAQKLATELGLLDRLHLWPDKALRARQKFAETRVEFSAEKDRKRTENRHQRLERRKADENAFEPYITWLDYWHQRVSEWPGPRRNRRSRPRFQNCAGAGNRATGCGSYFRRSMVWAAARWRRNMRSRARLKRAPISITRSLGFDCSNVAGSFWQSMENRAWRFSAIPTT